MYYTTPNVREFIILIYIAFDFM